MSSVLDDPAMAHRGLSSAEAARLLALHGPNRLESREKASLLGALAALARQFTHLMALLLWLGGALAWASGTHPLAWAIWAVNLVNGAFGFFMERAASRAAEALAAMLPPRALVVRDGRETLADAEDVVPGDLLILAEGDRVPADARIVSADAPRVDESALTGESLPVSKNAAESQDDQSEETTLLAGSTLVAGNCRAVVTATGASTRFGRIATATTRARKEESPLERELSGVARVAALCAVVSGALFLGLAWALAGVPLSEGSILALGLVVAFVPEGLLPVTTLSLSAAARRMARRNALVKRLSTVEGLGAAEVICTDKTGTLTLNELTVTDVWIDGRPLAVSGAGFDPAGEVLGLSPEAQRSEAERRFLLATALCGDARIAALPLAEMKRGRRGRRLALRGDPVDVALRVLAEKAGLSPDAQIARFPRLYEHPFDSSLKRMSVAVSAEGGPLLLVKGAPAETLALCDRTWRSGESRPLTESDRAEVLQQADGWAAQGLRVLLLACRSLPDAGNAENESRREADESGLELLGLAAMFDPPRPGVAEAMAACREAGVRVVMITGDHPLTASTLAKRLGVAEAGGKVILGADVESWPPEVLRAALSDRLARGNAVCARMAPEHKLAVVEALQARGLVVAVTGDGVNDAPALKKADIGISMGQHGTDAAKEASDMILLDDNFATIVAAIEEGRAVWDNLRRFVGYIFSSNMAEAVPFALFALSRGRIPLALGVMHVLLVDLGADLAPALGLGMEPPARGIMRRPPRGRNARIVDRRLLARAFGLLGPLMGAACMAGFYLHFWMNGHAGHWLNLPGEGGLYASATAAAYGALVFCQIGGAFAWREPLKSRRRTGVNATLWAGLALAAIFPALVAYAPFLQAAAGTGPIGWADWAFMGGCAAVVWGVGRVVKTVDQSIRNISTQTYNP